MNADTQVVGVGPRITRDDFISILQQNVDLYLQGQDFGACYDAIVAQQVDPLFGLAVFNHESNFGKTGVCHTYQTYSPGNSRSTRTGVGVLFYAVERGSNYIKYPNLVEGYKDFAVRITDTSYVYVQQGATTIGKIIPIFAPATDNNSPDSYISSVVDFMTNHQSTAVSPVQEATPMATEPTQADIGYPVTVLYAKYQGPSRSLSDIAWFIVHDTEGGVWPGDATYLANPSVVASAHAVIGPAGDLYFEVPLTVTAWTPGNDVVAQRSINVELSGKASEGYTDAQYHSLANFFNWCIKQGCTIPGKYVAKEDVPGICGHQDVANPNVAGQWGGVSGHTDPGPLFDWAKLENYIAGSLPVPAPVAAQDPNSYQDPVTSFYVINLPGIGMLDFWKQGGVGLYGHPLEGMHQDPDGIFRQVFENVMLEAYPTGFGATSAPVVRLGGLGQRYMQAKAQS